MKYVIVLGDGMADEPIKAAGGKTPLQLADKPVMDEMGNRELHTPYHPIYQQEVMWRTFLC